MIYHEMFSQHLRAGNWLFKYAWSVRMKEQFGEPTQYPEYYLWQYLKVPPLIGENLTGDLIKVNWEYSPEEDKRICSEVIKNDPEAYKPKIISLDSFFQSEKWFENYKDEVWLSLLFEDTVKRQVYHKYLYMFQKLTIGIGIRLGDFIGHGDFYQIDPDWYISALNTYFPNWEEKYNVVVFSDDIKMGREIFKDFPFEYAEPNGTETHKDNFKYYHGDASEQLILGYMMDNFIIGNSTFSWWQAWLSNHNKKSSTVIHSGKVFSETGNMKHINTKDYYPERWIKYE